MATYKNPVLITGGNANPLLTCASTLTTPASVKSYLDTTIALMPTLESGEFFAANRTKMSLKNLYQLAFFSVKDGVISCDAGTLMNYNGELTACAWTASANMRIDSGNIFEFIKADE